MDKLQFYGLTKICTCTPYYVHTAIKKTKCFHETESAMYCSETIMCVSYIHCFDCAAIPSLYTTTMLSYTLFLYYFSLWIILRYIICLPWHNRSSGIELILQENPKTPERRHYTITSQNPPRPRAVISAPRCACAKSDRLDCVFCVCRTRYPYPVPSWVSAVWTYELIDRVQSRPYKV